MRLRETVQAELCKDCATAVFRYTTNRTMLMGCGALYRLS